MSSFDSLIELFNIVTDKRNWGASPPTETSIAHIKKTLGVDIPTSYRWVAERCPNYSVLLNGIGEDYNHPVHIICVTHAFQKLTNPVLPSHFVMLNDGHDGDCYCWDLRERTASGDHPIVFVNFETPYDPDEPQPARLEISDIRYESFVDYFELITLHNARGIPSPQNRKERAEALIQQIRSKK